ncbi:fibronectin type III domain-containing protein [Actinomadura algeriensis]|uniref:Fibronectin type-III domain-containing protein n=1 Tax=Actinomadura algeriensis TaxID=1679523 RepID=A0ABR9JQQ9_9ACTN|nr:fibronectin type III domain-containing protein [Actinomadura algeriensis]MBE1532862.1 hypothetical protein [Actinomadura algeriensis]
MVIAPNLVVAGHPDLARELRATGRFPAVFDVASATQLRDLSRSGGVGSPAAFVFAPGFEEDLTDAKVPLLANGLAGSGFTVLVHACYTARGDVFDPPVIASTEPMSMPDLLATLGALQPDLHPEPPPEPWEAPGPPPARPPAEPGARSWPAEAVQPSAFLRSLPAPAAPPPAPQAAAPGPVAAAPAAGREEALPGWAWDDSAPEPAEEPGEVQEDYTAPPPGSATPDRRRRAFLPAAAVSLLLAAVIGAYGLAGGSGTAARGPAAPGSRAAHPAAPTSAPTAVRTGGQYVPRRVRIADGGVSIEVSWEDGSEGKAAHYVVGGVAGRPPATLTSTPPGTTKVTVTALNPGVDYCLTVVAVTDVDRVSPADPVCTHRVERIG